MNDLRSSVERNEAELAALREQFRTNQARIDRLTSVDNEIAAR